MPRGDGTGPNGTGGRCTPLWRSGKITRPMGFGRGMGRGFFGQGYGMGYYPEEIREPTKEDELRYLEEESGLLSRQLEGMKKRIDELKK